jgi:diacylglycerol kinase family enzyme
LQPSAAYTLRPVRGLLLINPRSGDDRGPRVEELRDKARARGLEAHVLAAGEEISELALSAEVDVLGAAGGDGTLASVAAVAVDLDIPFVVIPFGTRNHFARDLGLDPGDPFAALAGFGGDERRVDVGRAGKRRFLNNVSLGLYAALVHRREHHRRRREVLADVRALGLNLSHRSRTWATIDGEPVSAPVLLVANNAYELSLLSIGERRRLDEGSLYVYSAQGWLPRHWDERRGDRFTIDAPGGRLEASVDGEPAELETPLELSVDPGALRVRLPRAPG